LKSASPSRQEHARLEVENAEDDLVQKTEVAITLMKAVLDNVCGDPYSRAILFLILPSARTNQEPQRTSPSSGTLPSSPFLLSSRINLLLSMQLRFYAYAAEALSSVQGEIEELSVAAEGDYRCF
jgi:hypothetical protein